MYFFLGTHCGARRCALPPAPPHPLLFSNRLPFLPTPAPFFHMHRFIWVHLILIDMYRNLCLCTFFLERIAGGGAAPLFSPPPCTPPPAFIFNRLPVLPTPTPVFKMHRLFGFILSLLISIETCAYVLLSWYALRGEPPCTPHPLMFF